ncbi:ribonuclease domain-containing protein [Deinococcus wulumuqiensis]|jgi:ribonuclease T1|uniref:Ribonuclease n=1 Tax=Deinococcus wulumuqiensis TaxID=980427 RepID=A0A345IDR1_9DEIO|nr:ribonuclease domain-containing protein [Deinococcus wulumuqiensis]AXG97833.1 ribonuclease [Deinococcus wulumuqiensis]QII20943.1 ribonuclease [Deinococcus wulumuqiensis R12]GGI79347.1 ribonuclease [Deinococcus wulumuqiensis]GGP28941.1 ribonuclease [Deinococcus wulumuqiensis]
MSALRVPALLLSLLLPSCSAQTEAQGQATRSVPTQSAPVPAPRKSPPQPTRDPVSGLAYVNVAQLPREGQQMLTLIGKGGPFRYSKDGVTFGNREGLLPRQARGYYREYTVKTPGESDRGARRIVCGGQPVTSTAECYYTADHYASFRRIRP